ncbi:hypothetical protein REPUB_Repub03eG0135800 [Reevesia pubescens]
MGSTDFNIVRTPEEKLGLSYGFAAVVSFSDSINSMDLVELPLTEGLYTCATYRESPTMYKLYRLLISGELLLKLSSHYPKALPRSLSYNNPIFLLVDGKN